MQRLRFFSESQTERTILLFQLYATLEMRGCLSQFTLCGHPNYDATRLRGGERLHCINRADRVKTVPERIPAQFSHGLLRLRNPLIEFWFSLSVRSGEDSAMTPMCWHGTRRGDRSLSGRILSPLTMWRLFRPLVATKGALVTVVEQRTHEGRIKWCR